MPNSARIRHKKVNLVFIIYMVEIELNAGSKGSKMSDVIFFSSDLQINQQFFSSIKPKKLEKGCPNYNCFNQNIFLLVV